MELRCLRIELQDFFPKRLEITAIEETENIVNIHLKSRSKHYVCPLCGKLLSKHRATYDRKAQDLPIIGKAVFLTVNIYEYQCEQCNRPVVESFEGFLKSGNRLTERCEDFIVQLALESSCEGASRILKRLGVSYSGDSIIRLLLKRLKNRPTSKVSSIVGVDDFAYKRRHYYGTVIVDEATHKPVALLDGRDGTSLREWLRNNQHVKVITRDRASEYAKAIQEELPNAIQVADRFHLYENFLQAIKRILNSEIPSAVAAENVKGQDEELKNKKESPEGSTTHAVSLYESESNRLQKIMLVRSYVAAGNSIRKTARDLKVGRDTVAKYLKGDPKELCRWHGNCNRKCEYGIEPFLEFITECINAGKTSSETHRELQQKFNYNGSLQAFSNHLRRNARQYGWIIRTKYPPYRTGSKNVKMVSRSVLFHHLWDHQDLQPKWKAHIFENYPVLHTLDRCIQEFRDMFQHKCVHRLRNFIERYSVCGLAPLESFAKGLLGDIDAVKYAVSSDWSNGFVEGINNRLKTIKRTMYGRCGRRLLEAKMLL